MFAFRRTARLMSNNKHTEIINSLKMVQGTNDISTKNGVCLELFASWCGPCMRVIPHVNELSKKYTNVSFIGVNTSEPESKVRETIARFGNQMTYNVACDPTGGMEYYSDLLEIRGIPHAIILSPTGEIKFSGHPAEPDFETQLAAMNSPPLTPKGNPLMNFRNMTLDEIKGLSVGVLQDQLAARHVNYTDCFEKVDLVDRVSKTLGYKK